MKQILLALLLFNTLITVASPPPKDTLNSSLGLNFSFGMMSYPAQNIISVDQSYNLNYNIKYKKMEFGLGIDYFRYSWRTADSSCFNNIWSLSGYWRRYFSKRDILYAELFLNSGYWFTSGDFEIFEGNRFISTCGIGVGLVIPPLTRMKKYNFFKNLYGLINYRESFINRDIGFLKTDVNIGLIYKF